MASRWTDPLIFVVNLGRSFKGLLKPEGPIEGGGPPDSINVYNLLGDGYPPVLAELLSDDLFWVYQGNNPSPWGFCLRLYERR